ncbi:MAG: hypothetical protein HC945_04490, partial [Nitrosarchaeum sp.]|nr:hypothetical protein [Nitrosarchaeum sp.]
RTIVQDASPSSTRPSAAVNMVPDRNIQDVGVLVISTAGTGISTAGVFTGLPSGGIPQAPPYQPSPGTSPSRDEVAASLPPGTQLPGFVNDARIQEWYNRYNTGGVVTREIVPPNQRASGDGSAYAGAYIPGQGAINPNDPQQTEQLLNLFQQAIDSGRLRMR